MTKRSVLVTWTCIVSMLHMGCYSAALIDPAGPEKDSVYTDKIKGVVTKDGTKYDFDEPAKIISNAIVGSVKISMSPGYTLKEVTIPLSEIEKVQVSQFNAVNTVLLVVGFGAIVAGIYAAILTDTMTEGIESLH
jgi:hypothetical protein